MFKIVAMICAAGMSHAECGPEPGFSRDVAVVGEVPNELACILESQGDVAKSAALIDLAPGEFIKIMCVRQ